MAMSEITCSHCAAFLNVEFEDEDFVKELTMRFVNKHVECGLLMPPSEPVAERTGQVLKISARRPANEAQQE